NWIGAAAIPRKILTFSVSQPRSNIAGSLGARGSGAASVIYRSPKGSMPDKEWQATSDASESTVTKMRAGVLRGDAAFSVAARIRVEKHVDPVLGAISAYLYESVGDIDSIRRIAWFYADANEPIPFDIALLANLNGERRDGRLYVSIPPVPKRAPRTADEACH